MSQDPERDDVTASATASASASAPASASAHYSGSSLSVRCGIAAARGWRGKPCQDPCPSNPPSKLALLLTPHPHPRNSSPPPAPTLCSLFSWTPRSVS